MENLTINIKDWNAWLSHIESSDNLYSTEDAVEKYAAAYNLPTEIIKHSLKNQIDLNNIFSENKSLKLNLATKSKRLDELRVRSGEHVKNANKLYKEGLDATKKEAERADNAETELSNIKRQLELTLEILNKSEGGISEIEVFLTTLDENTKKNLTRAVQKSLHPDKHPGVNSDTNKALNNFFSIINKMFDA